ncbi:hypothetical protein F5Y19DRAFT_444986 [Xylariaceae sp. FL1651]|nr:hypothetical protein F5Y19DRAFT_444986 [Xylariaceae sp. FL1651]
MATRECFRHPSAIRLREAVAQAHATRQQFDNASNLCRYLKTYPETVQSQDEDRADSTSDDQSEQTRDDIYVFRDCTGEFRPFKMSVNCYEKNYISVEAAKRLQCDCTEGSEHILFWYRRATPTSSFQIEKSTFTVLCMEQQVVLRNQLSTTKPRSYTVTSNLGMIFLLDSP